MTSEQTKPLQPRRAVTCRPRSSDSERGLLRVRRSGTATAAQIEFGGLVTEHLTHQGTMDPGLLYEPPFTDIAPTGPEQVFDEPRIGNLSSRIQELNESAVA